MIDEAPVFTATQADAAATEPSIAVVFCSKHAGNTRKLVDELCARHPQTRLYDVRQTPLANIDLAGYDLVVFASGVYFGAFNRKVLAAAAKIACGQRAFLLYTTGALSDVFMRKAAEAVEVAGGELAGSYMCLGYYQLLPFLPAKNHGHPTREEVSAGVDAVCACLQFE